MEELYVELARIFNESNGITSHGDTLVFKSPINLVVQSLGGTAFEKPSIVSYLVLYLNIQDDHHQAQRMYANDIERILQAAVGSCDFVQKKGIPSFIKSILGPPEHPTLYRYPSVCPILHVLDVCFTVKGANVETRKLDNLEYLYVTWDLDIKLINAQAFAVYSTPQQVPSPHQPSDLIAKWKARQPRSPPGEVDQPIPSPAPTADPKPTNEASANPAPTAEAKPLGVKPMIQADRPVLALECPVCFEQVDQPVALVPCGHATYCWPCSQRLKECAVCRAPIQLTVKLFQ